MYRHQICNKCRLLCWQHMVIISELLANNQRLYVNYNGATFLSSLTDGVK